MGLHTLTDKQRQQRIESQRTVDCKQGQRTGHDEHSRDLTHCSSNSGRHPASIPGGLLGTVATTVLGALGSRTDGCRQRSVGARKAPPLLLLLDHVPIGGFRSRV